jgi:hypothetical protein
MRCVAFSLIESNRDFGTRPWWVVLDGSLPRIWEIWTHDPFPPPPTVPQSQARGLGGIQHVFTPGLIMICTVMCRLKGF